MSATNTTEATTCHAFSWCEVDHAALVDDWRQVRVDFLRFVQEVSL